MEKTENRFKRAICEMCMSTFTYDTREVRYRLIHGGALTVEYITCPCCGAQVRIGGGDAEI